jgi:hypothetical protein
MIMHSKKKRAMVDMEAMFLNLDDSDTSRRDVVSSGESVSTFSLLHSFICASQKVKMFLHDLLILLRCCSFHVALKT